MILSELKALALREGLGGRTVLLTPQHEPRLGGSGMHNTCGESQGLKIFLASATVGAVNAHAGNCGACHQTPDFSDFVFHNNGVTHEEYDSAHGQGAFANLFIPTDAQREAAFDAYMPASPAHPNATESFRRAAVAENSAYADLGLWNVYPNPQTNLAGFVCASGNDCSVDKGLPSTIARFKTPVLRDLETPHPIFTTAALRASTT